jgi:hypothetical protein
MSMDGQSQGENQSERASQGKRENHKNRASQSMGENQNKGASHTPGEKPYTLSETINPRSEHPWA